VIIDQINEHVWSKLSFRKHLAGRIIINRIVARAVRRASGTQSIRERGVVLDVTKETRQDEVGMGFILGIFLSILITEVVKILVAWIKERQENRALLLLCQKEKM